MQNPDRFSDLPAYAFPRLRGLLDAHEPGGLPLHMSIGEPKHAFPDWLTQVIADHAEGFGKYPPNDGAPELLAAQSDWVNRRYGVSLDPDTRLMALNGTREGLYNVAMALCPEEKNGKKPVVLVPNPFYQVYAVAALSIAAEPVYVPADRENGFLPDFASLPPDILDRTVAAYICSPSNPQGAIAGVEYWESLLDLAEQHDFRIFADECYCEIYRDTPPPGLLQVQDQRGADPERVVAFHSLSKRSNLPGLRSGFVAAGPDSMVQIRKLRAYSGSPLPLPLQRAAERVWSDEDHVIENRRLYCEKFDLADRILGNVPEFTPVKAGFFLWLPVPDGEEAAVRLWRETGLRVLPGAYLGRSVNGVNPGDPYIRVALVAPYHETERGLTLLRDCLYA